MIFKVLEEGLKFQHLIYLEVSNLNRWAYGHHPVEISSTILATKAKNFLVRKYA